MNAYILWHRFDGISPAGTPAVGGWGLSPYPPLRPTDTAVMDAIGEKATMMRSPVEVVCRRCYEWVAVVFEFADEHEQSTGAIACVRGETRASYVPLDSTTPAALDVWCPKDRTLPTLSAARLNTELSAARDKKKVRVWRHS